MRAPTVTAGTPTVAGWAELDVEKVVDEPPQPTVCPEQATRCTEDEFGRTCEVREGQAMEYDGYLWQASELSIDYGTGAFKLTAIDPESDCGVVSVLVGMHEGSTGNMSLGGFDYAIKAERVQAESAPTWVLMRVSREVSYCEAIDIPIECDVGTESGLDTIRCPLYVNMGAIKFGNIMFAIDRMYSDAEGNNNVDVSIHDAAMGCSPEGGRTVGEFGVSNPPIEIGLYRYQITVGAIDRASGVADVRITREKIMCGPETHYDPMNVGGLIDAPNGYKVRLDDLTRDGNGGIFTVINSRDAEVFAFVLNKGDSVLLPEFGFEARVDEVAPGLLLIGKWAKLTLADCTL
jgi:hypothetical protein